MLSDKLVKLIEENAEKLTARWIEDVTTNSSTPSYKNFSRDELHNKVYDVYQRLGHWLEGGTTKQEIARHYTRVGRTRCLEKFKLSEVIYATILAKRHLLLFIDEQGFFHDMYGARIQLEFHDRINVFFDKIIFFETLGYENAYVIEETFYAQNGMFDKIVAGFANWIIKK